MEEEILKYVEENNAIIEPDALELLKDERNYHNIIDDLLKKNVFIIRKVDVETAIVKESVKIASTAEVVVKKTRFKAKAKDVGANFKIMEQYDVTNQSYSEGKVADFVHYFREKFEFLFSLLKTRPGFNPKEISQLKHVQPRSDFAFVGIVNRKWETKKGHLAFDVEDLNDKCIVVVSKENRELTKIAGSVILDDVIGIRATKLSKDMVLAKEILRPDLAQRPFTKADRDLSVVVTSDMHVGSKLFMEREFNKFVAWLNGKTASESETEKVGKIKYMFVVGDNVDGVGVYPNQYDELAIKDIFKQYELFAEYIKSIPDYIQIFICPGQHDAVRRADPQPAIPKEFTKDLRGQGNISFIGSPSWVVVEGLKCLIYHGASLHDLYASVNFLSAKEPQKAMIELLKRRDLMSTYGGGNPYVPEQKDFMLVREEPDFYFGGDMHHNGYDVYRACMVVNSGTWQKQTEYQIKQGHVPTPGIVPEIELKTRHIRENVFLAQK